MRIRTGHKNNSKVCYSTFQKTFAMETARLCLLVTAILFSAEACLDKHQQRIYFQLKNTAVYCWAEFQDSTTFTSCRGGCSAIVKHEAEVNYGTSDVSTIPDSDTIQSCKGQLNCCVGVTTVTYDGKQNSNLFNTYCWGSGSGAYSDLATRLELRMPTSCNCGPCHSDTGSEITSDVTISNAGHCKTASIVKIT